MIKVPKIAAALILSGVAACGDESSPEQPVVTSPPVPKKVVAAPTATSDAGSAAPLSYVYSYIPLGKRDPFRLGVDEAGGQEKESVKAGDDQCDDPLCKGDLDSYSLVAVVSGDSNPMAMVEDGALVGHIVRRNTRIGRQGGKVTAILRDCIVVTSFVRGPDGRAQPNRQNICVKKEEKHLPVLDLMDGKVRE